MTLSTPKEKSGWLEDRIADRHEWFRKGLIAAEIRALDIKRFENEEYYPQILLDIVNGVAVKLPPDL